MSPCRQRSLPEKQQRLRYWYGTGIMRISISAGIWRVYRQYTKNRQFADQPSGKTAVLYAILTLHNKQQSMNNSELNEPSIALKLRNIIADHLGYPLDEVTAEKRLYIDFHADSLDKVEILLAVEDAFKISIDDSEDDDIVTVQDFIDVVLKTLKN